MRIGLNAALLPSINSNFHFGTFYRSFLESSPPFGYWMLEKKKETSRIFPFCAERLRSTKKGTSLFSIRVGSMQSFQKRKESASKKSMWKTVSCLEFLTTESIYCKWGRKFAVPKFIQEILRNAVGFKRLSWLFLIAVLGGASKTSKK